VCVYLCVVVCENILPLCLSAVYGFVTERATGCVFVCCRNNITMCISVCLYEKERER